MNIFLVFLSAYVSTTDGLKLHWQNWDMATAGKTIIVRFWIHECTTCIAQEPAWDKLTKEWHGTKEVLIGEVDCTSHGDILCDTLGVNTFPLVLYGSPGNLKRYDDHVEYSVLHSFVMHIMEPMCGPRYPEHCGPDEERMKDKILKLSALPYDKLHDEVDELERKDVKEKARINKEIKQLRKQQKSITREMEIHGKKGKHEGDMYYIEQKVKALIEERSKIHDLTEKQDLQLKKAVAAEMHRKTMEQKAKRAEDL